MSREAKPTGKILLRLDPELHARLIRVSGKVGPQRLLRGIVRRIVDRLEAHAGPPR